MVPSPSWKPAVFIRIVLPKRKKSLSPIECLIGTWCNLTSKSSDPSDSWILKRRVWPPYEQPTCTSTIWCIIQRNGVVGIVCDVVKKYFKNKNRTKPRWWHISCHRAKNILKIDFQHLYFFSSWPTFFLNNMFEIRSKNCKSSVDLFIEPHLETKCRIENWWKICHGMMGQ